jgi:pimeloyl-ACP methyl ester carboxylesterase
MDGTGLLFGGLIRCLVADISPNIVRYPTSEALGYDELIERIAVPEGDLALVAESFSGPLAIRLAAQLGDRARAIVLVATFARSPSWLVAPASLLGELAFQLPLPRFAVRAFLLDRQSPGTEVDELQRVIGTVSPSVMSRRLREIAKADVREELAQVRCLAMYIRGARDRLVGMSAVEVIRDAIPALRVETLDAPHLVLQRNPEQSGRLISDFIRQS